MSARVPAALLTVAAVVAMVLLVAAPGALRWQAHPGTACDDLTALQGSLDLTSLGDQSVIRARAVQLAAALSEAQDEGSAVGAVAVHRRMVRQLKLVIADPEATSHDLASVLAPLSRSCGVTLEQ